MMIFLTEQDVQVMRPGRTVFLDLAQSPVKQFTARKVVLSLHKDAAAIHAVMHQAGWGAAADALAGKAPVAESDEECCIDCGGINKKFNLYIGKCIVYWYKRAMANLRDSN